MCLGVRDLMLELFDVCAGNAIIWRGESLEVFHLIGMMLIPGVMVLFNR
jgi:hypothetical protein